MKQYYSFIDDQLHGKIMHVGRNSTSLDELVSAKLDYHSLDSEENFAEMYDLKSIKGQVSCCYDFEFHIIKHMQKLPESDFDETTKNFGTIDYTDLSYAEAIQEFSQE